MELVPQAAEKPRGRPEEDAAIRGSQQAAAARTPALESTSEKAGQQLGAPGAALTRPGCAGAGVAQLWD